jgi:hypothetical protein
MGIRRSGLVGEMKSSAKIHIPKSLAKALVNFAIPNVFLILARQKILKEEHLQDPQTLVRLILKHKRAAIQRMKICWTIDEEFLNEAVDFWKKGKKNIAIVLYATAVEQFINYTYQMILDAKAFDSETSTELIRYLNVDAKLGWMFRSFVGHAFPQPLGRRLRRVFSIRNAIVHFKAIPGRLDYDEDSSSRLEAELKGLRRVSLSKDFSLLEKICWDAVLKTDPDRELALKAAKAVDDYERPSKKIRNKM